MQDTYVIESASLKHLLIVYHSKTGHTEAMIDAAFAGANHDDVSVAVRKLRCQTAGPQDLLWADGIIFGTPENFGYMAGAMKDFFDRTFYEVEGKLNPLPYALVISAGNDGSGARRSIERIVNGYPMIAAQPPVICQGEVTPPVLEACTELGMTMAAGIELGVF